jgi:hypothetical protein
MPHILADRVREAFTSTGPGNLTLAGARPGFRRFLTAIGVGNTAEVCAVDPTSGEWEVFMATVLSGTALERGTLIASSSGSRISFATGSKDVFACLPASETMRRTDIIAAIAAAGAGAAPMPVEIVTATTYSLTVANAAGWKRFTGNGCTVTVPTNATQPIPVGTEVRLECVVSGVVPLTLVPAVGVTINALEGFDLLVGAQYGRMHAVKVLPDEWTVWGDLVLSID